jgi:hypothetical protein
MDIEILNAIEAPNGWIINGEIFIPNDPENGQYQIVREWIDAGGVVLPAIPIASIPVDEADIANASKQVQALGLVMAQWMGKTEADLADAYRDAYTSLPS